MQWGMFLLTLVLALLYTGTVPIPDFNGFPTHIFNSPIFLAIVVITTLWTLGTFLFNRAYRKDFWLVLLHFSLVIIITGALIRMSTREESLQFPVYYTISGAYLNTISLPSPEPENNYRKDIPLGFSIACDTFRVDHYTPDIELMQFHGHNEMPMQLATFPGETETFTLSPWIDSAFNTRATIARLPMRLSDTLYLTSRMRDKWYSAQLSFGTADAAPDGSDVATLEPNAPVTRNGWRFYLMDYGSRPGGDYIVLTAVRDPGRIWVLTGIWLLVACVTVVCFRSFRRMLKQKNAGGDA